MFHSWLEKTFREDPIIPEEDFIKPIIKETKPKQVTDKEPNPNAKEQVLENNKNEFVDRISKVIEDRIDDLSELNPAQKEVVKKALLQDMQSLTNEDDAIREAILTKYFMLQENAAAQLKSQSQIDATVLDKISGVFNELFGIKQAHAHPAAIAIAGVILSAAEGTI